MLQRHGPCCCTIRSCSALATHCTGMDQRRCLGPGWLDVAAGQAAPAEPRCQRRGRQACAAEECGTSKGPGTSRGMRRIASNTNERAMCEGREAARATGEAGRSSAAGRVRRARSRCRGRRRNAQSAEAWGDREETSRFGRGPAPAPAGKELRLVLLAESGLAGRHHFWPSNQLTSLVASSAETWGLAGIGIWPHTPTPPSRTFLASMGTAFLSLAYLRATSL